MHVKNKRTYTQNNACKSYTSRQK